MKDASNRLLNVEDLTEDELHALHRFFGKLAEKAKTETSLSESHSVEEAEDLHDEKVEAFKQRQSTRRTDRPVQKQPSAQTKKRRPGHIQAQKKPDRAYRLQRPLRTESVEAHFGSFVLSFAYEVCLLRLFSKQSPVKRIYRTNTLKTVDFHAIHV